MIAQIIIKNNKGKVMQEIIVNPQHKARVEWEVPLIEDNVGYGGFEFEFTNVHKLD